MKNGIYRKNRTDRQIDKQTDRQIDRQIDNQIEKQIDRQIDRQTDRQIDSRQIDSRQILDGEIDREKYMGAESQINKKRNQIEEEFLTHNCINHLGPEVNY